MFRSLCCSASRSSRASKSEPVESKVVGISTRAIHISEVKRLGIQLPRWPFPGLQPLALIVVNAKGAVDYWHFFELLQREKRYGELDPTCDSDTDYLCGDHLYNVRFEHSGVPAVSLALFSMVQHVALVFTYDASSRQSWDEMVAAYEDICSRSEDGVLPFLVTMIAAMDGGEAEAVPVVSHAEAEAFATQRGCQFDKFSPSTGSGICDAVGSLVELAHGARDGYGMDDQGNAARYKRAQALKALFSGYTLPGPE
ncbi:hypothetical protein BJX64DRAFT_254491 [Aspergillus heterothallicus]